MLSASDHGNQDKYELSNMVNKYQLLVYLADSLFDDEQYKRAEVHYEKVLSVYKSITDNIVLFQMPV